MGAEEGWGWDGVLAKVGVGRAGEVVGVGAYEEEDEDEGLPEVATRICMGVGEEVHTIMIFGPGFFTSTSWGARHFARAVWECTHGLADIEGF